MSTIISAHEPGFQSRLMVMTISEWRAHTKEGMHLRSGRQVGASTTKEGMRLRSGRQVGNLKISFADLEMRVDRLAFLLERITSEVKRCGYVPQYTLLGAINFLRYHCIDLLAQLPRFSDTVLSIISYCVYVVNLRGYEDHGYPDYMKKRINDSYRKLERKTWRMESRCDYVPRIV